MIYFKHFFHYKIIFVITYISFNVLAKVGKKKKKKKQREKTQYIPSCSFSTRKLMLFPKKKKMIYTKLINTNITFINNVEIYNEHYMLYKILYEQVP